MHQVLENFVLFKAPVYILYTGALVLFTLLAQLYSEVCSITNIVTVHVKSVSEREP